MYEHITYETILEDLLNEVPDDIDKREGSIIYNALAPAAKKLQLNYIDLDVIYNTTFADTAPREELIRRGSERGIMPYMATNAILKGRFNIDIPIGSRYFIDTFVYKAIERIAEHEYKMECETSGLIGNTKFGTMIPMEYIPELERAELIELLIPGEDEEDTEHYRTRYFKSVDAQTFGGNLADYMEAMENIQGVGNSKVYPVWNGGGTVKIVFTNAVHGQPSDELVVLVQNTLDPDSEGKGLGTAPIGHRVTVEGAKKSMVTVTSNIVLKQGYDFETLRDKLEDSIRSYFLSMSKEWASVEYIVIRTARIDMALLGVAGVLDVSDTCINGMAANLELSSDEIPELEGLDESFN